MDGVIVIVVGSGDVCLHRELIMMKECKKDEGSENTSLIMGSSSNSVTVGCPILRRPEVEDQNTERREQHESD